MADAEHKKHFRHISDIDVWLTPDRNYFVFILLSVFGGFLALDHIYLRSFETAFQKVLYNFFGLGIWYFWDLIQIFSDGKKVRSAGLSSPFDWTQGIGRGVFTDPEKEQKYVPEKSYIIWAFLAIFGGFLALDKFYIGDTWHGVVKLVSVFSPIFLFGLFWVAWDAFHAYFMTKQVVGDKISLPFPLTWIGFNETDGSIFLPSVPKDGGGGISGFAKAIWGIPSDKLKTAFSLLSVPPLTNAIGTVVKKMDELKAKVDTLPPDATVKGAPTINSPLELLNTILPEVPAADSSVASSLSSLSGLSGLSGLPTPPSIPSLPTPPVFELPKAPK
jgi:TM2 domain-containing membrane protein YozV